MLHHNVVIFKELLLVRGALPILLDLPSALLRNSRPPAFEWYLNQSIESHRPWLISHGASFCSRPFTFLRECRAGVWGPVVMFSIRFLFFSTKLPPLPILHPHALIISCSYQQPSFSDLFLFSTTYFLYVRVFISKICFWLTLIEKVEKPFLNYILWSSNKLYLSRASFENFAIILKKWNVYNFRTWPVCCKPSS